MSPTSIAPKNRKPSLTPAKPPIKVRKLEKGTDRFENPRDKRVTGESGSFANEPCDPVGQANWGQDKIRGTKTTRLNVVSITDFDGDHPGVSVLTYLCHEIFDRGNFEAGLLGNCSSNTIEAGD